MPPIHMFENGVDQLNTVLTFRGEEHLHKNLDIFMSLPERQTADVLYREFHHIKDDPDSLSVNTNGTYSGPKISDQAIR